MTDSYRIFGAEMSPYSVKVRSYFRYKQIPHRWLLRNGDNAEAYQKYARIPIVPLVVTPDGTGIQDSTPIIEQLDAEHPQPSIHPPDPVGAFVSAVIEEFGDEWGNKWMFHHRWARPVDQEVSAMRIARSSMPQATGEQHTALVKQIRERMVDRVWFVGSNSTTAPLIETSFRSAMAQLDTHLATRPYLFGGRPSFGDFGLWGQVYNAWTDPTAGSWIEGNALNVLAWVHRMTWPRQDGDFEPWDALAPTLMPFLTDQVGGLFMPWTLANSAAIDSAVEEFSIALPGGTWVQKPQKYHAKSLQALREKYAAADHAAVDAVLGQAGILDGLRAGPT